MNYHERNSAIARGEDNSLNDYLRRYDEHGSNCGCLDCWDYKETHCRVCDAELNDDEVDFKLCFNCLEKSQ